MFLLHSRINLASANDSIRFLNYILFEVPGILVHAPAHLFWQGIAAELSRRIENVTRNRLMGGAPANPGARQPADPLPARTLPPDEQKRRIELFCDKVTRLFTSELSMSAADFTFHLVSYPKKQVSAMMEMQEASFSAYTLLRLMFFQEKSVQTEVMGVINANAEHGISEQHKDKVKPLWDVVNAM